MCTCNGKEKKPADKQWKEKVQRAYERGIKQINVIDMASIACDRDTTNKDKQTNRKARRKTSKQANKKGSKQAKGQTKMVSTRDKCRFRLDVHSFIVLKYGQHTSKQDSCMDM